MSAAESQEELFEQVLALPYMAACEHTPNCPRGCKCYIGDRDCVCADIDCDECLILTDHIPWQCPNFNHANLVGFMAEPAVIKLIAPEHEKLIARGFSRTNNICIDIDYNVCIVYDDVLGPFYLAELLLDLDNKVVKVFYYIDDQYGNVRLCESNRRFPGIMASREKIVKNMRELEILRAENATLRKENIELKLEIEYQPGGSGYERARESFVRRSAKQNAE